MDRQRETPRRDQSAGPGHRLGARRAGHPGPAVRLLRLVRRSNDDIPELATLARTISRWEDELVAATLTGVTNARSESLNRIAKLEARNAYCFRNPANQRRRVRTACTRGTRRSRQVTRPRSLLVTDRKHDEVDLGPARLPVLLRVADYADALERSQAAGDPAPDVYEFLGRHTVGDEVLPGDMREHAMLIQRYLSAGEALVLVDGLDEITDVRLRQIVSKKLDSFAREHVVDPVTPGAYLPMADQEVWWVITPSRPAANGGNQLIVTSRIAGYKEAALTGAVTVCKILPLTDEAIRRFTRDWCLAVERFRARSVPAPEDEIMSRAAEAASELAEQIFREPPVRRLAANPLLLTVLAMLRREQGRMPTRRVDLYEWATRSLVERRQTRAWSFENIIDILGPFALWLQETSNTGHARESELRQHIRDGLQRATEQVAEADVDDFVRSARDQAGLLIEVGVGRYGFLHGTFREYLTAREATRSLEKFQYVLQRFLHTPRWAEVLLLGTAIVSRDRPADADGVLEFILGRSSPLEDLLRRDLIFAASCLHEMPRVTPKLAGQVIASLFQAAAWAAEKKFDDLRQRLVAELVKLSISWPRATMPRLFGALLDDYVGDIAVEVAGKQERPTMEPLDVLETACRSPRHGYAAFAARAAVALALFRAGALTDTAYEPKRNAYEALPTGACDPAAGVTRFGPALGWGQRAS